MNEFRNRPVQTCGIVALVVTMLVVGGVALALWARATAVGAIEARNRADAIDFARQLGYTEAREIGIGDQCMYWNWGLERTCTIYVMFTSPLDKQAVQQLIDQFPPPKVGPTNAVWENMVSIITTDSGRTIVETVPPDFHPSQQARAWYWSVKNQQGRGIRTRLYEVPRDPRQYHIDGVLARDNVIFVSLSPD